MIDLDCPLENPFSEWSDWLGVGDDVVVTFQTMRHQLWETWETQCVNHVHPDCDHGTDVAERANCNNSERVVDHSQFDSSGLLPPGIHHQTTGQEAADEYDIIVPYPTLTPELCEQWIEKLNEEYSRQFRLVYDDP